MLQIEVRMGGQIERCLLDTGTTWNVLNDYSSRESIEQTVWSNESVVEIPLFEISNQNFGPLQFHKIPLPHHFQVQAILGIEFFKNHLVFLDFVENAVYFAKNGGATTCK